MTRKILFILILFVSVCSCDNTEYYDIYGDKGVVYVDELKGNPNYLAEGFVYNTPRDSNGSVDIKFPVRANVEVTEDVEAFFRINNDLVASFNERYNADYGTLDPAIFVTEKMNLRITRGEMESKDSLHVYIPKEKFAEIEPGDYLIPVELEKVNGYLEKTVTSVRCVYYMAVSVIYDSSNIRPHGSEGTDGTLATDRSGWNMTCNGDYSYGPLSNLIDGDTDSYSGGNYTSDIYWLLDLGKVYSNILGTYILHFHAKYQWVSVKVSTSVDGEKWIDHGTTTPNDGTWYSQADIAKFISHVEARYIKLEAAGGLTYGNLWFVTEFNIYE